MSRLITWLGDDFTGSAAVLEVLSFAGIDAVLFSGLPSEAMRNRFSNAQAIGIATTARAQTPEWMRGHLPALVQFLDQLKGELETLGDELTRQNVSALKNLQQRVKDLKKFELALEGHGFDEEIQGYKQEVVESLIETMHQAQQQFDTQVKKGCWDELQQPHKFLQKAVDILRTSGWIGKEQYVYMHEVHA